MEIGWLIFSSHISLALVNHCKKLCKIVKTLKHTNLEFFIRLRLFMNCGSIGVLAKGTT